MAKLGQRKPDAKVHFLLRPEARRLTHEDLCNLGETEARIFFENAIWKRRGYQGCWRCGEFAKHYKLANGRYKCRSCKHVFSVLSGTIFRHNRIGYARLLRAILTFAIHRCGCNAILLSHTIDVEYKNAFVLLHKIRSSIVLTIPETPLEGLIHADGAHFSGRRRKPARKKQKRDPQTPTKYRRGLRARIPAYAAPFHPNRRIVMVFRQVGKKGEGALASRVAIVKSENREDVEALAELLIKKGSTVYTDEWKAYAGYKLMGYFHDTVNHQIEWVSPTGVHENQAESLFSRMRSAEKGIYRRMGPHHMLAYACEINWREDTRRLNNLKLVQDLCVKAALAGPSKDWGKGYSRGPSHGGLRKTQESLFTNDRTLPWFNSNLEL